VVQVQEKSKDELGMIETRRKQVQAAAVRLFKQIKNGCTKEICFNNYCKKNPNTKEEFAKFSSDREILLHLTKVLINSKDPETLICPECVCINAKNIDTFTDKQLIECYDDMFQFCCGFVDKTKANGADPITDASIDFATLTKFNNRISAYCEQNKDNLLIKGLNDFLEIIDHQVHSETMNADSIKTSVRGFVMLFQMNELENFNYFDTYYQIIRLFKVCHDLLNKYPDQRDKTFLVSFLAKCVPKDEFTDIIQKFQNYITIIIMSNNFTQDQIMHTI
jgi:hypothetical protein